MKKSKLLITAFLACSVCAVCASASYNSLDTVVADGAVTLAEDTVKEYREDYYDVSNLSTQIESIEYASNKVNVIARVEYDTIIKASTPEDSPYIQGIEGAIEDLTDEMCIRDSSWSVVTRVFPQSTPLDLLY